MKEADEKTDLLVRDFLRFAYEDTATEIGGWDPKSSQVTGSYDICIWVQALCDALGLNGYIVTQEYKLSMSNYRFPNCTERLYHQFEYLWEMAPDFRFRDVDYMEMVWCCRNRFYDKSRQQAEPVAEDTVAQFLFKRKMDLFHKMVSDE